MFSELCSDSTKPMLDPEFNWTSAQFRNVHRDRLMSLHIRRDAAKINAEKKHFTFVSSTCSTPRLVKQEVSRNSTNSTASG